MTSDYPFVIRHAANPTFIAHVQRIIDSNIEKFTPNPADPEHRKFWTLKDNIDRALAAKKLELIRKFSINDWAIDPTLHDLIGYISEGGFVHPHRDPDCEGRTHVRINLLVSAPDGGGVPVLDGIPIDIQLGDAWLCLASQCRHAMTPVEGRFRSIISYGLQVHRTEGLGLLARYLGWAASHRAVVGSTA